MTVSGSSLLPPHATREHLPLAFGGVVVDPHDRVLLRHVSGRFGGYSWTLPKGRPDPDETPEATALREVREETGVVAEIVAKIPSEFHGSTSVTIYFLMRLVEVAGPPDSETDAIEWVDFDVARTMLEQRSR